MRKGGKESVDLERSTKGKRRIRKTKVNNTIHCGKKGSISKKKRTEIRDVC